MTPQYPVAIVGSDDLGTDLMVKILDGDGPLALAAVVDSVGDLPAGIQLVFDTTARGVPDGQLTALRDNGIRMISVAATATGSLCVPAVNLDECLDAPHLDLGTFGAQATIPIVAAIGAGGIVCYAEIVASVSAKSAGPAARATIDQFLETTAAAVRVVGGAQRAKAVLILNPANPPIPMRNTVYCLLEGEVDRARVEESIADMVDRVAAYVPGYRLRQGVQFETFDADRALHIPETGKFIGTRVTVLLEVVGAGPLPAHAGSRDIVASAAIAAAERLATHAENARAAI